MFKDILAFNEKFGLPVDTSAVRILDAPTATYKLQHLTEELNEIIAGQTNRDLPHVADGIVDFVYVALGVAAFQGIDFDKHWRIWSMWQPGETYFQAVEVFPRAGKPHLLPHPEFIEAISMLLGQLATLAQAMVEVDEMLLGMALTFIVKRALQMAVDMSIPFDRLWDAVHAANMAKERAASAEEAKKATGRSSSFDIIKPEGWQAPDIEGILREYSGEQKVNSGV